MRRMQPSLSLPLSLGQSQTTTIQIQTCHPFAPRSSTHAEDRRGRIHARPGGWSTRAQDDTACVKGLVDAQRVWPAEWPVCWWLNSVWIYARPLGSLQPSTSTFTARTAPYTLGSDSLDEFRVTVSNHTLRSDPYFTLSNPFPFPFFFSFPKHHFLSLQEQEEE